MKNQAHRSRYKPGHGCKMQYKVHSWYHERLGLYSGAIVQSKPYRHVYGTPLLPTEPEVHALLMAWLRAHSARHKEKAC
jgi:hypothetical protein